MSTRRHTRALLSYALCFLSCVATANAAEFTDFGAIGDGTTDNTPAFATAIASLCASPSDRTLHFPVGKFRFASYTVDVPCAITFRGEGEAVSQLVADFDGGWLLHIVGGTDGYGGGSLRDVKLLVASGRRVWYAIWIQAHLESDPNVETRNPHGFLVENVLIGRDGTPPFTGTWIYGVYLDGSDNAQPVTGVAPFLRMVKLHNITVSAADLPYLVYYTEETWADFVGCVGNGEFYTWHAYDSVIGQTPMCVRFDVP